MRLFAFVILLILMHGVAMAAPPLPSKKPITKNFQDILDSTVKFLEVPDNAVRVPSPPPQKDLEKVNNTPEISGIILPPSTPESKKPIQPLEVIVVEGIPLPSTKPFVVKSDIEWRPAVPVQKSQNNNRQSPVIPYSGDWSDDRTAGIAAPSNNTANNRNKIDRTQAKPREKLRETSDKSPFPTAQLPRAAKYSMDDPVIIFFREASNELEIGQIDVLQNDILRYLRQSRSKRVAVYGYAENAGNTDKTNQLSLSRALIISEYLADNGIEASRVEARAMGSDTPISPKNRVDVILY